MSIFQYIAIGGIWVYRGVNKPISFLISTIFGYASACKHSPTCSEYAIFAIQKYGTMRGLFYGIRRLIKCW